MNGERVLIEGHANVTTELVLAPEAVQRLRVVCAWRYEGCQGDELGVLQQGDPGADTTHGLCLSCKAKFLSKGNVQAQAAR